MSDRPRTVGDTFELLSEYEPAGDQPQAIEALARGYRQDGKKSQTLLGMTGSGKTFTMAHCIADLGLPTLVISHNKTLAAQLYGEFRELFPHNAVEYFVSYYDYYQPEAYIPAQDIYIAKDASINEDIDRLRLSATSSLMSRRDVIIVASVSCIYGLGSPEDYKQMTVDVQVGHEVDRDRLLRKLVDIQYDRSDYDLRRATFRPRGDVVEILPAYEEIALRIDFFGDEIEEIAYVNPLTGDVISRRDRAIIYPAKHFVLPEDRIESAMDRIEQELEQRIAFFRDQGKYLEAERIESRTRYDMELLREIGYCPGIENYSRHLAGRGEGERPFTLIDYFPDDYLCIVDESHVTVPQIGGMFAGDRSRKETLVGHGFRLPSALDNRPMMFEEWEAELDRVLFVSATPEDYELEKSSGEVVEQVIRPTGLVDPRIVVKPARGQVNDLIDEIHERVASGDRVLVTTLTKRMAEDLSDYILDEGIKCCYLHSEIDAIERVQILRDLRLGKFDVIVGVNLLREGLDLPEVSLVAILDADKEGFLRSQTSLIQTIGRSARNVNATVILYADELTGSMERAIDETGRRRRLQLEYNREHDITPETIRKEVREGIERQILAGETAREVVHESEAEYVTAEQLRQLEEEMLAAADRLEFERAAELRDKIEAIKGEPADRPEPRKSKGRRRKPSRQRWRP
ncbi:MAG: excinuclease ABC subunit UvrB [Planctomycetota bacterium]